MTVFLGLIYDSRRRAGEDVRESAFWLGMPIESFVVRFVESHAPLVCAVGAFVGGDALIIFLSSLSGQGVIGYWTIILFWSLGTVAADTMWFFLGRTRLAGKILTSRQLNAGYAKIERILTKYGKNDFFLLLIVKFIYGIRVITIVYFSRERRRFDRFCVFNSIAVFALTVFITSLGWLAGRGIRSYVNIYKDFTDVVKVVVIVIVAFFILRALVNKWMLRERKART